MAAAGDFLLNEAVIAPDNATQVGAFIRAYPGMLAAKFLPRLAAGLDKQPLELIKTNTPYGRPGEPGIRGYYPEAQKLKGLRVRDNWEMFVSTVAQQSEREQLANAAATTFTSQASGVSNLSSTWTQEFPRGGQPLLPSEVLLAGLMTKHPGGIMLWQGTSKGWQIRPRYANPATGKVPKYLTLNNKGSSAYPRQSKTPRYGQRRQKFLANAAKAAEARRQAYAGYSASRSSQRAGAAAQAREYVRAFRSARSRATTAKAQAQVNALYPALRATIGKTLAEQGLAKLVQRHGQQPDVAFSTSVANILGARMSENALEALHELNIANGASGTPKQPLFTWFLNYAGETA